MDREERYSKGSERRELAGSTDACITLAHGEGGRLMRTLINEFIIPTLAGSADRNVVLDDASRLPSSGESLAITTDSYVVSPLFFPGGDIGSLAIFGTVNDLVVNGSKPIALTLSLILEEGLSLDLLQQVLRSAARAADATGVPIIAGDTKVVPRGAADGVYLNTTGVGLYTDPVPTGPSSLQEGDAILVSGPIGRHGVAVLCARFHLGVSPAPTSDSAPLLSAAANLRAQVGGGLRAMRDATRGGVAAVLHEWAEASNCTLTVSEELLPTTPEVRGVCELLGLDPIHVANEGTMVVAVDATMAEAALAALRSAPGGEQAAQIAEVRRRGPFDVTIRRTLGPEQPLDDPLGAPLPRIC